MFAFHCPREDARVLVWPSDLEGVVDVAGSPGLVFRCGCGWRGVLIEGEREVIVGLDEASATTDAVLAA